MDLKEIDFKAYFEKIKQKLQELTKKKPKEEGNTETESVASTGKNPLAFIKKLPKSSQKKLIMSIGAAILGLIVLYAAWQYWSKLSDTNKATQYVMQQVSSKPVMVQQLGTSITSTARGEGNVQMPAMTGQMIIPVKGSQGTGSLDVTLNNGNIDALWLTKSDGNRENIIALEKQAQAQAQQKAAEQAKQQAVAKGFDQAVSAMKSGNYAHAIAGFENAVQANYRLADSYEYLGIIYSQQGDYNNCIVSFIAYLKLTPDDANAHYQLAYCYLQRYETDNAMGQLQTACQLGNQDACQAMTQIQAQKAAKPSDSGQQMDSQDTDLQQQLTPTQN